MDFPSCRNQDRLGVGADQRPRQHYAVVNVLHTALTIVSASCISLPSENDAKSTGHHRSHYGSRLGSNSPDARQ